MTATPRPWRVVENQIWAGDAESLALVRDLPGRPPTRGQDNADLIVGAVNAFDALLAVAKAAADLEVCDHQHSDLVRARLTLDAAHPGWREWAP